MQMISLISFMFLVLLVNGSVYAVEPIGEVRTVSGGEVGIYRNPVTNFTNAEKDRRLKMGITSVLFDNKYWEAYEAKPKFPLLPGDLVNTRVNTRAVIMLGTKRIIVGYNTQFTVNADDSPQGFIDVAAGKIRAIINEKREESDLPLNVRTRTAVMGVRGTDFYFSYGNNWSQVATIEGLVSVANLNGSKKSEVLIQPGKMTKLRDALTDQERATLSGEEIKRLELASMPHEPEAIPPDLLQDIKIQTAGLVENDKNLENMESKL